MNNHSCVGPQFSNLWYQNIACLHSQIVREYIKCLFTHKHFIKLQELLVNNSASLYVATFFIITVQRGYYVNMACVLTHPLTFAWYSPFVLKMSLVALLFQGPVSLALDLFVSGADSQTSFIVQPACFKAYLKFVLMYVNGVCLSATGESTQPGL